MDVTALSRDYYSTDDSDLRYMLLRQLIDTDKPVKNVDVLFSRLLIPILWKEQSFDIIDLISSEIIPKLLRKLVFRLDKFATFKKMDGAIVKPLIAGMDDKDRGAVFVQALKNVLVSVSQILKDAEDIEYSDTGLRIRRNMYFNEDYSSLTEFLEQSEKRGLDSENPQLYEEILTLFVASYFNGTSQFLPSSIVIRIFTHASKYHPFSPSLIALLRATCRCTSNTELKRAKEYITDDILLETSKYWYKYNLVVNEYFETRLYEILIQWSTFGLQSLTNTLGIISNFSPYYGERLPTTGMTFLSRGCLIAMMTALFKILSKLDMKSSEKRLECELLNSVPRAPSRGSPRHESKKAEIASKQQESSTDAEQLAYIKELTLNLEGVPHNTNYDGEEEDMYYGALGGEDEDEDDEEEQIQFEDENEDDDNEVNQKVDRVAACHEQNEAEVTKLQDAKDLITEILREFDISVGIENHFLTSNNSALRQSYISLHLHADEKDTLRPVRVGSLIDLNELKTQLESDGSTFVCDEGTHQNAVYTLQQTLLTTTDNLETLQLCLDVADKLMKSPNVTLSTWEKSVLCLSMLPHLMRNKNFIKVIIVGNIKHKIDESESMKIMIYSILLQTTGLPFNVSCKVLEQMVQCGIKDKNSTIRALAAQVIQNILDDYYFVLLGLTERWYYNMVFSQIIDALYKSPSSKGPETSILSNILHGYPSRYQGD